MKLWNRLIGKKAKLVESRSEPYCDVCGLQMQEPDGYILTTRQIVTKPEYWELMFSTTWASTLQSPDRPKMIASLAQRQASQTTPWLLCEPCATRLAVATSEARSYAQRWWKKEHFAPPGSGPVDVSEVRLSRPPQSVTKSGVPLPNQLFLIGANFEPSGDDFRLAANGLVGMHSPLTLDHFYQIPIEIDSTGTGDPFALSAAIDEVKRRNPNGFFVDVIQINTADGRHMAAVAMWTGEAIKAAKLLLLRGEFGRK